MILVMEGPDRVGKTEIGKELAKYYSLNYFKYENETNFITNKDDAELACKYQIPILYDLFKKINIDIVFDRFYLSEYIYAKIFRKANFDSLNLEDFILKYDELFSQLDIIVIYCYKTKYLEYSDKHIDFEKIKDIHETYLKFLNSSTCSVIKIDTSDVNLHRQVNYIGSKINQLKAVQHFNKNLFSTKIESPIRFSKNNMPGYFNGDTILFCGQNPGQPGKHIDGFVDSQNLDITFEKERSLYFNGLLRSKIGKYLQTFLNELKLDYKDVSFMNVVKYSTIDNQTPTDQDIYANADFTLKQIDMIKPSKIVAIGNFAYNFLTTNKISCIKIPHPASHRYDYNQIKNDVLTYKNACK